MIKQLKDKITLIKQDIVSKKIISVQFTQSDNLELATEAYIDCYLDSILYIGNFETENLKEIESVKGFHFSDLLPVVTVDTDNRVLMQAFVNVEALSKTFETGFANYFSRSRNKIWLKGESSDNRQIVEKVYYNEKEAFFVYMVKQKLAACHEGFYSCFFRKIEADRSFTQIDFDRKFKPEKVYG